jgi:CBS domain containing-hemolysin-like protein
MYANLGIAVLLLVANAFFVAAEFALVKLKSFRIDALAEAGNKTARLTQRIHKDLEAHLAACQLGITMASLGLGWVGEPTVAVILEPLLHTMGLPDQAIHSIAFLAGFIIFSSLHIVVGEQVPKTFAIRKPEPVSLWVAYPLRAFYLTIFPLNWLLNAASGAILRMFGVAETSHSEILSGKEIQGLIEESEKHGNIETEKATMLNNLFQFDNRTAEEIMVPRGKVAHIDLQDSWEDQLVTLNKIEHSRFPVLDGGEHNLVGVLLAKDLYRRTLSGEKGMSTDSLRELVREPLVVPEFQQISILFETMKTSHNHMAVVIDEYGDFAGVVTMEDLLEEIVGEIEDELDQTSDRTILNQKDKHWEADGWTQLSDIERTMGIEFDEKVDANTLSGMFMYFLSRVPESGDSIETQGIRFTVESLNGRRVDLVKIEVIKSDSDSTDGS